MMQSPASRLQADAASGRLSRRDDEQAKAERDKSAERDALHNVRSVPHWDPAEAPAERGAKGGQSPK